MASLPLTNRWRILGLCSGLLILGSVWLARPSADALDDRLAADRAVIARIGEEATPDCGMPEPETDPAEQRAARFNRLGVDRWHAAGVRGKGVKIAVLDTGFRGYRTALGKALPAKVVTRSFRPDGDMEARESQHGILCGEVLHALAPTADMLLATWDPNSPDEFLQAARWARSQGVRIISCSVIMPSWSDGEGGGPIHEALAKILGNGDNPGDILCIASAGNTARRHWYGKFQDDGDGWHAWQRGKRDNRLRPWGNDRVSVELCCQPGGRYQLEVFDASTHADVGRTLCGTDPANCCAVVRFMPILGHRYLVRVRLVHGKAQPFHVVALGGELDYATAQGSIPFPGDGSAVIAVGAVDCEGRRLAYSSCGSSSGRPKPDFVAPVPFSTLWRDRPFTGTSAAAPQVAGLAALCWSRHPDWTAAQVRDALRRWARDLGPQGHDCETGYGLAILPPIDSE